MKSIGFRAENQMVRWAVVEGTSEEPALVGTGKLRPPKQYGSPAAMAWYRERVHQLVEEHGIEAGGIRHPESFNKNAHKSYPRIRIEGVLEEALATAEVDKIVFGPMKTISSELGSKAAKKYLSQSDLRGLDWADIKNNNDREAVMVAVAALED